jgi:acyl carrier protein
MGLDGAELVMEVEDHFGITIGEEEGEHMRTVCELTHAIFRRIEASRTMRCVPLRHFFKLRSLVRDATGNPELRIHPGQQIDQVLTAQDRKRLWPKLEELLTYPPERLRLHWSLAWFLTATVFVWSFLPFIIFRGKHDPVLHLLQIVLGVAIAALTTVLLYHSTKYFRQFAPRGYKTFGDIIQKANGLYITTKPQMDKTFDDVFSELKVIIVKVLNVKPESVTLSASFVEDLGMD